MKVNPILKKWTQNDPHSFDLDNPNDVRNILYEYRFGTESQKTNELEETSENGKALHNRSASKASQYSVATAGSGQRAGFFVHPFQQTPRPFTPTYTAPTTSSIDLTLNNDFSSRWIEEEVDPQNNHYYFSTSNSSSYHSQPPPLSSPSSHIPHAHFPNKSSFSRLALVSSYPSHSSQSNSNNDFSSSRTTTPSLSSSISIEKGFRLRSRSEVINRGRAKSIQEARRRFIEKERVQEEKAAREEIRQLEKRQQKEAIRIERSNRQSSASLSCRSKRSKSDATSHETSESLSTISTDMYISADMKLKDSLISEDIPPGQKRGSCPAKQKTYSAWAMFLMWFRMRLMHLRSKICYKSSKY
ncbi:hypothetical protein HI914_00267 [Erysiphe necator]|uniref:Uncharacterized protein n=1 Tax=Uncinula necator TaxID=52586 RepID=A0A0B1P6U4_UNCNE|nr:hypothetical protein HI914_00267 [Erysiphe necator]KHJ34407.1 hypothetical protein EV44_g4666 [Erysiphe necator]